jgi:diketogulonate reductase-like aldo/keto reductase
MEKVLDCKSIPNICLRNGISMPILGLGTSLRRRNVSNEVFLDSVKHAFKLGYRHIDTAKCYNNEHLIAKAIDVNLRIFIALLFYFFIFTTLKQIILFIRKVK